MKCPSKSPAGSARLIGYVAGRLNAHEAAGLTAHLRHCEACSRFVSRQSEVWSLLDEWTPAPPRPGFAGSVFARIRQAPPEPLRRRLARAFGAWIPRPAFTVPLATALLLGTFFLGRPAAEQTPLATVPTAQAVTTYDADQLKSALDDLQLLHQLDLVKDEAPDASRSM